MRGLCVKSSTCVVFLTSSAHMLHLSRSYTHAHYPPCAVMDVRMDLCKPGTCPVTGASSASTVIALVSSLRKTEAFVIVRSHGDAGARSPPGHASAPRPGIRMSWCFWRGSKGGSRRALPGGRKLNALQNSCSRASGTPREARQRHGMVLGQHSHGLGFIYTEGHRATAHVHTRWSSTPWGCSLRLLVPIWERCPSPLATATTDPQR
jgi:hypothetical protein